MMSLLLKITILVVIVGSCLVIANQNHIGNILSALETSTSRRGRQFGGGCPLCDSSVYSYCSYKLDHDSCCCGGQYGPAIPAGCQFSDCQILYAKSCYEHHLIRRCCCENPYQ